MNKKPIIIVSFAVLTMIVTVLAAHSPDRFNLAAGHGIVGDIGPRDKNNVARYTAVQGSRVGGRITINTPKEQCSGPGDTWVNHKGKGICLRVRVETIRVRVEPTRGRINM